MARTMQYALFLVITFIIIIMNQTSWHLLTFSQSMRFANQCTHQRVLLQFSQERNWLWHDVVSVNMQIFLQRRQCWRIAVGCYSIDIPFLSSERLLSFLRSCNWYVTEQHRKKCFQEPYHLYVEPKQVSSRSLCPSRVFYLLSQAGSVLNTFLCIVSFWMNHFVFLNKLLFWVK